VNYKARFFILSCIITMTVSKPKYHYQCAYLVLLLSVVFISGGWWVNLTWHFLVFFFASVRQQLQKFAFDLLFVIRSHQHGPLDLKLTINVYIVYVWYLIMGVKGLHNSSLINEEIATNAIFQTVLPIAATLVLPDVTTVLKFPDLGRGNPIIIVLL